MLVFLLLLVVTLVDTRPHVVVFVIDDVGWNDVSFRSGNASDIQTPTIDTVAAEGVVLDNYYTQPVCSPSRTAFMQGRFPFRNNMGLQHYCTIAPGSTAHMKLDQPTIAELLKASGYKTAAVGKWHAGYANFSYTPTGRGFESHAGYFQGEIDYYNKTFAVPHRFLPVLNVTGLDWWHNRTVVRDEHGIYNKILYDQQVKRVLDNYTPSTSAPLFLYFAHQIAHVPLEAPSQAHFGAHCTHIGDPRRRVYCAMLAAMDDSLRLLLDQLRAKNMMDDTLLIITTDNGGMPQVPGVFPASAGVNFPLRAGKGTAFQGGVRGVAIVAGGANVLPASARGTRVVDPLLHVVDWFPTIAKAAGVGTLPANLDGRDLWPTVLNHSVIVRDYLPININKKIQYPNGGHQLAIVDADGWKLIDSHVTGPVLNYDGWFTANGTSIAPPPNPTPGKFLFNIKQDPNEHQNLYSQNPQQVARLRALLSQFETDYQDSQSNFFYPAAVPWFHNGVWAPFHPIL